MELLLTQSHPQCQSLASMFLGLPTHVVGDSALHSAHVYLFRSNVSCAPILPNVFKASRRCKHPLPASILQGTEITWKSSRHMHAVVQSSMIDRIQWINRPFSHQFGRHRWQRASSVGGSSDYLQANARHRTDGRGRCSETGAVAPGLAIDVLRAGLLAVAFAVLLSSRAAHAADSGAVPLPSLPSQFKDVVGLFGTKIVQLLGVFRDQGLFLTILLGISAFFSMAETSITTLWPWKVRELADKETEGGVFQLLRRDMTRFLTTILIGTTVANIAATALVTDAATTLFGEAGVSAATAVMTVVILLLTEITPKNIAVHNATEVARVVVRPVAGLSYILYPVGRIVTAISMGLLKVLGLKSSGGPFVTEEELKLMLRGAELSGAIEEEEQDMIENVLEIKDTYVREVMTPLVDVVAIDASATLIDFQNLWVTQQYSRVPVFERRVDNIVGIGFAMDMLDYVGQAELLQGLTVGRIAHKPAYFVPDSMSVWNLLREFRIRKVHMAIVLNEYGGTVGVVTLEDVVEEIVGEIFDENDSKEEIRKKTGYVVQRADGVFDVDANTSIEDLSEALELKIPDGPYHYETVSGFVCEAFGYIPRTGESINIILQKGEEEDSDRNEGDSDNQDDHRERFQKFKLEILAGNARKVGSIRFERLDVSEPKFDGNTVTRMVSHILRNTWEGEQGQEHGTSDNGQKIGASSNSSGESERKPESNEQEGAWIPDRGTQRNQYLIAESIDVDNMSDSEFIPTSELTFVGDQEWDIKAIDGRHNFALETNGVDTSTASAVDTLNEKCEKHESFVEKRRQRRRKQSAEAALELDKHRKVYIKRREAALGMRMNRKKDNRQLEQGGSFNTDKVN